MTVVAFDFDGTLTTGETWKGIVRYLGTQGRAWEAQRLVYAWYPRFILIRIFKLGDALQARTQFMVDLSRLLKGYNAEQMQSLAAWVVEHELWPKRRQAVLHELEQHQRAGNRVIVASGAFQEVLATFCARLGVEAFGTILEQISGTLTGKIAGGFNVAENKAKTLRTVLGATPLESAYGDTEQDLPMLKMAAQPVVVGDDPKMVALARANGWRVLPSTD